MTLKVACIGLGRIGALLEADKLRAKPCTHMGAWSSIPDVEVSAICDSDQSRAETVALTFDLPRARAPDWRSMLDTGPFDIISIATPIETHAEIVIEIAKRKAAKVIFCEKPIATKISDGVKMVKACEQNNVKLAINHTRRWDSTYSLLQQQIKVSIGKPLRGIGIFSGEWLNDGVHMADLANWFQIPSFYPVNIPNNEADYLIFDFDVLYQQGRIKIWDNGRNWRILPSVPSNRYEGFKELPPLELFTTSSSDIETPMLRACKQLVRCINQDENPYCTGRDGLEALRIAKNWVFRQTGEKPE